MLPKILKTQRRFTLIGLLAVIAIMTVLAGIVAGAVTGIGASGQATQVMELLAVIAIMTVLAGIVAGAVTGIGASGQATQVMELLAVIPIVTVLSCLVASAVTAVNGTGTSSPTAPVWRRCCHGRDSPYKSSGKMACSGGPGY